MITTANEIYCESNEVSNIEQTINEMLDKLVTETNKDPEGCQVVIQLNHDNSDGHQWKMFIYHDPKCSEPFYYSFQNETYFDTDFFYNNSREAIAEQMKQEIENVGGFEWICVDF